MVSSSSPISHDRFTLGPWQVDVSLDTISGHGKEYKLEPRAMRLLSVLAQAEGKLVRTDDLLDAVWPQVVVTPGSLYEAVAQLRKMPMGLVCLAFCRWRESQFGWNDAAPQALREQALHHAERAVALDDREPDAHYVLGLVSHSMGEAMRAEECLRHCIRLSGSHAPAHGLLAMVRTRLGFPQEAAALCARAFALSPREPLRVVWYLALAWAGLALRDFPAAFKASQQGMAVNPDFATLYVTGAAAAQHLGLRDDARRWVAFLRERTVFNSVDAVRHRLAPPRNAAHQEQMDGLVALLAAAGLP